MGALVHLQVTSLQEAGVTCVTGEVFTNMNTIVLHTHIIDLSSDLKVSGLTKLVLI